MRSSIFDKPEEIRDRQAKINISEGRGCLRCGSTVGVEMESSRTQYHFEGEDNSPDDPNKDIPLCRPCAAEHHEYWDDMWREYYGGRL